MKKIILFIAMTLGSGALLANQASLTSLTGLSLMGANIAGENLSSVAPPQTQEGTFILTGEPGEGQSSLYIINFVGKERIEKWSSRQLPNGVLNTPINLRVGWYNIGYENSIMFFEIKENETLEIPLGQIEIEPKGQDYTVSNDLTSPEMQDKVLKALWSNFENEKIAVDFCSKHRWNARAYCTPHLSQNLNGYSKSVRFTNKGEWEGVQAHCRGSSCTTNWISQGRFSINHTSDSKKDITYIAVLPGTYIVTFKSVYGKNDVYGVIAK